MAIPRRCSLVFSLQEALWEDGSLGGPEPDYLQWLDGLLSAEIGTAFEHVSYGLSSGEDREAWRIYGDAVSATHALLQLSRRNFVLFERVARHFSVLPCLMSRHPAARGFNQRLFKSSQVGEESILCEQARHGQHHAYQSSPVRYAYALVFTIDLTLDTYEDRLPLYAEIYGYGIKRPIDPDEIEEILAKGHRTEKQKEEVRRAYRGAYRILPNWTKGLERLRRPFSQDTVLGYWRKAKEIMLEEMPDFHERPEWKNYRERKYAHGAKRGAIQHAIFKDILAALKTIAGGKLGANGRTRVEASNFTR
jgi:hypothetical protein